MKKSSRMIALLLAIALVLTLGPTSAPGQRGNRASAEETAYQDLNQQEIVEAMGAGWNLGNQLEANSNGTPAEDAWTGLKVTEGLIRRVKTSGFKSIRIPVSYLSRIGASPDYTINKTWLNRVQEVVDWAIKYKLYVVMNIHGDGYTSVTGGWIFPGDKGSQDVIKAKYEAVWRQLAERFKDYDQHLIFESMNEIGADIVEKSGVTDEEIAEVYENINAYNQIFVDTVRQSGGNNDKRWLLVPGLNTNIDYTTGDYGFKIPEDTHRSDQIPAEQKRIMISVHYYDPWAFCGQEDYNITQWGEEGNINKKVGYGQEDDMQKQFAKLKTSFTSKGYPVVIGEYGAIDKSVKNDSGADKSGEADPENGKFRESYAAALCHCALQTGCVPIYWDNGWNGDFGFGLFDRKTNKVTQPGIIEAIMSSYDQKEGTATAIALDKKSLELDMVDGGQSLQASLTPSDAQDTIQWESSDTSVASVSYKGTVIPKGAGTCLITATVPGGASAYCVVKVKQPIVFKAGLYGQNAADWNVLEGDNYLELTQDGGGTFTISFSGTKEQMSKLNTLFIKDVTVQRGVSETSILNSAQFEVESLQFNGNDCTMTTKNFYYEEMYDTNTSKITVPDICMLNYWYDPANCITDLTKNPGNNNGCSFPEEYYVDGTNTLTMKVTVKNAVLKKDYADSEIQVTALSLEKEAVAVQPSGIVTLSAKAVPENATEKILWFSENKNIAEVAQDGTVTGIKQGEVNIHAMTASGQDVICKVTVDENAAAEPTAEPSADPGTVPTPEPSTEPTAEPSAEPSTEPTAKPTAEPSTEPSAEPSTKPSAEPSTKPSDSPEEPSPQEKTLAMGTAFTAGKFKYKVTGTAAGKTAVAVQGAKSKKEKSLAIPAQVTKNGVAYSVTSVGANAFKNCKKLKKITIGKNITAIGKNAFSGDKALRKITVKSSKLKKVGKNALKGIHKKAVIKVPKKKLKKYKKLFKKKGQKKTVKIK